MKRIPSNCAVSTLLTVCPSDTYIEVLDFPTEDCTDYTKGVTVYRGLNDLNSYKYAKIVASKVRRVSPCSGTHFNGGYPGLVISICTKYEQY